MTKNNIQTNQLTHLLCCWMLEWSVGGVVQGAGLLAHRLACAWLQHTHCILQHMVHYVLDLQGRGGEGRG